MIPKARRQDILVHSVDGEVVVYDKTTKEAHRLNETLAKVWDRLDGKRSTADLAAELGVDESVISLSVDELVGVGLLESGDELSVSRRSALRRVAAAAAVGFVLPAVTSIAAPMAAQAQSGGRLPTKKGDDGANFFDMQAKKKAATKKKPAKKKPVKKKPVKKKPVKKKPVKKPAVT